MTSHEKIKMTLRLEKEENERLAQYAKSNGMTKTSAIRSILQDSLFFDRKINDATFKTDKSTADKVARLQADRIAEQIKSTQDSMNIGTQLTPAQQAELIRALGMYQSEISDLTYELNKIGTNINQLSRSAKIHKKIKDESAVEQSLSDVNKLLYRFNDYLNIRNEWVVKVWRMVE
ncbi:MAG: hypothetical protein RR603_00385 [Kurthia sp.]